MRALAAMVAVLTMGCGQTTQEVHFAGRSPTLGTFALQADHCHDTSASSRLAHGPGWSGAAFTAANRPGLVVGVEAKESAPTPELLGSDHSDGVVTVTLVDGRLLQKVRIARSSCAVFRFKREHVATSVRVNGRRIYRDDVELELDCSAPDGTAVRGTATFGGYCG